MPKTSAAQLKSALKHQAKLDRIVIQPPIEEGQAIRAAAVAAGQSTQAYILQAIRDRMGKGQG